MTMTQAGETTVAKVGGSLFDMPELADRLAAFLALHRGDRVALVAGGGHAANFVRSMDRVHGLGEIAAHALAIRSLDLTARSLAAIVPGLVVAETLDELHAIWSGRSVAVLAPRRILDADADPLPSSWDVTTDSIAARLAVNVGADRLVLLKSVAAGPGTSREEAAEMGLVDPRFPHESRRIARVSVVNLRDPAIREVELSRRTRN